MRRDLTHPILDLSNNPIVENNAPVTLCTLSLSALMMPHQDELPGHGQPGLTGKQKADRYALAMKINANPSKVDLTIEQMALLKELIGKGFGPLAVGRAYELLEQEPKLVTVAAEPAPASPPTREA